MTRLLQWLVWISVFLALWLSLCLQCSQLGLTSAQYNAVLALPIYGLISFACYSLAVIGYRVYKFNDCEGAALELKKEIEEARKDLKSKGFHFDL